MTMLRRLLLITLALMLAASPALAAPRYPARQGVVTDSAAVLAAGTVSDLNDYAERLRKATGVQLSVVTVDFLDGSAMDAYGEGLFAHWGLGDSHLVLLLAVGEDHYGLYAGDDVGRRLTPQVRTKLLSTTLDEPFMRQQYDDAITRFIPALNTEMNKLYSQSVSLNGLFGTASVTAPPFRWSDDWMDRLSDDDDDDDDRSLRDTVTHEDAKTGFSLGKVVLTVVLLLIIFGKRKDGKRGCGCGCLPFSSLLAGLGLWKLWKKD